MVKVIIKNDGEEKVFNGEIAIGFVMSSDNSVVEADAFKVGMGDCKVIAQALSNIVPGLLNHGDKIAYIADMIHLYYSLEERIKEELKGRTDEIADAIKKL